MTLLDHAVVELDHAAQQGDMPSEDLRMRQAILDVITAYADQGHSGGSASVVGPLTGYVIERLLAYEPITPLAGTDDEWVNVADYFEGQSVYQNKRCGRVFKHGRDGRAYDIEAIVFRDWRYRDSIFQAWDSKRYVQFPYTPTTRYTRWRRLSRLWARLNGTLVHTKENN